MFRGIIIAAQSPQGLKGVVVPSAQHFLFVAISVVLTHNVFKKEEIFLSQKLSNRKM